MTPIRWCVVMEERLKPPIAPTDPARCSNQTAVDESREECEERSRVSDGPNGWTGGGSQPTLSATALL